MVAKPSRVLAFDEDDKAKDESCGYQRPRRFRDGRSELAEMKAAFESLSELMKDVLEKRLQSMMVEFGCLSESIVRSLCGRVEQILTRTLMDDSPYWVQDARTNWQGQGNYDS